MIRRTYRCSDCAHEFTESVASSADPYPDCPHCAGDKAAWVPGRFAIGSHKGKAIDFAQRMAEEDYGLTDMHDNMREGDIAAKGPAPIQTAEHEAFVRTVMEAAQVEQAQAVTPPATAAQASVGWGWSSTGINNDPAQASATAAAAKAARTEGADPISFLEKGRETGATSWRLNVHGAHTA